MEVDEIHQQPRKLSRFNNGSRDSNKIGKKAGDEDEEDGEVRVGGRGGGVGIRGGMGGGGGGVIGFGSGTTDLSSWTGSRIFRVSRLSGGKDRHSKVLTAKGLRDRRVRLSVSTAIQFYDLQDRLGYDQPSKAVEWLIKAAADAISELPSLSSTFPETPKPFDERRSSSSASQPSRFDLAELELETEPSYQQQQQHHHHMSLTKSGGSSTSETSKGSGLSLSRSENRVKARERARERTAKEKENLNSSSQNASFTDLLTNGGGGSGANENDNNSPTESNFFLKTNRHLPSTPMDYFGAAGIFGNSSASKNSHSSSGFSTSTQFGNHPQPQPQPQSMTMQSPFGGVTGDHHHHHHQELQQFSFMPDHFIPIATAGGGGDYNLNFSISSGGLGGFNRGTLQSNSQSSLPQLQRFSSSHVDGSNVPVPFAPAAAPVENHHQFPSGFDGRLQLYYADGGCRQSDLKGKGKN